MPHLALVQRNTNVRARAVDSNGPTDVYSIAPHGERMR